MPAKQNELPAQRTLPKKPNPELAPAPEHDTLVQRRRLGQTHLSVAKAQVGTSNATKPENLGMFDYAHLRAPLPKNLKGSEIFPNLPHPETYFLMRRSTDGFISATGMFKTAFPWAKHAEAAAEHEYLKSLKTTGQDEVAGNVWIPAAFALELAEEYGMTAWIRALVDEAAIPASSDDPKKSISPPPKFVFSANDKQHLPPPTPRGATPRARGRPRASSPAKSTTPGPKASPRKPRNKKTIESSNAASAREASASLQSNLDATASVAGSESVDGEKVTVEVESAIEVNGETETTTTNVKIEMPGGSANLPLPESAAEMLEEAKEMVEEAKKLEGESNKQAVKRKIEELDDEEDEAADRELQPAKKARLLEQQLKKEKVRKRALFGVAATLAIGAIIPYVI